MAESGLLLPGRLELIPIGAVAQLGARKTGSLEVRGSIPLSSTKFSHRSDSPKNHFLLFLLIEKIPVREIIGRIWKSFLFASLPIVSSPVRETNHGESFPGWL